MKPEDQIQPTKLSSKEQPLSWFQERLWLLNRRTPEDVSYNIPVHFLIEGPLDASALSRSLSLIINRHQVLRARFVALANGDPAQVIGPEVDLHLPVITTCPEEVANHVSSLRDHEFDLRNGPVLVAKLLRIEPQQHLLLLNMHHIVADGWSVEGILFSELLTSYQAYCCRQEPKLPPLKIQYPDFARWQRQLDFTDTLSYWHSALAGYENSLEMPTDFPRKAQPDRYSDTYTFRYSKEFSSRLDAFCQKHSCTMFMGLLAGFGLVVSRYTGREDICIGTTTSARTLPELEGLIGFFINILPLRMQIDEDVTATDYVKSVRALALAAFDHQTVPYERILYSMDLERTGRSDALIPLVLRHQNFPRTKMNELLPGGARFSPYLSGEQPLNAEKSRRALARCEIELSFVGDAESVEVEVNYASDLYRRETIVRLLAHHQHLIEEMITNDTALLRDLPILRATDVERLCVQHNVTLGSGEPSGTFVERFDAQARRTPERIACHDQWGSWTYKQMSDGLNRLANDLGAQGVKPGDVIALCMDRSATLLISMLAIWRCGAGYVPLDPSYPDVYLRQIIANAEPTRAICPSRYESKLGIPSSQCVILEEGEPPQANIPVEPLVSQCNANSLAYIMYTSGSTGTPKGVRVPHRQLMNWLAGFEANWPFTPGEVVGQKTTMAFAVSVKELFAGLLNGCPQICLGARTVQDTEAFVKALAEHRISRLNLVPSHLDAVLRYMREQRLELPALRMVVTAGEPLTAEVVQAFRELLPNAQLWNNYGCTELNDICYYDTSKFEGTQGFVPIGRPIQNTLLYVLDRKGRLAPEGVPGELHVSTASMSDGYHDLPELTEERYLKNWFGETPSDRLYNTGDVVRHLPDGNLEYIGRWDTQVKVRGFRVDVRQIEKILGEFPGVGARAVVGEGSQLLAYYTAQQGHELDFVALREHLRVQLPEYMVPSAFICLAAMPKLPNGKLDRRSLKPGLGRLQKSDHYEPTSTDTERKLVTIWSEVLEVPEDDIGRQTHFFEIGGHSLSATRVVARVNEQLGLELGLSQVFELPRLADLASLLDQIRQSESTLDEAQADDRLRAPYPATAARVPGLLEDKVILVTGSSRGIGSATVRLLARHGAKVAINYVSSESRAQRVRDAINQDGGTAETFQADVTQREQVTQLVDSVRSRFGRVDVLVSNAAIGFKIQPFVNYDWSDFERKVTDELKSMFYLCQAVLPEMIERKSGSIIAVSSSMSKATHNGYIAHGTAKAALDSFVRALASEVGPDGVRVNTVAPGLTLTDASAVISHQQRDAAAARCPLRRNGLPRDVAGAILFLASALSEFMTGAYLPVDGGFTML
jgi:amino acid adenylation domain-containing protein